MGLKVCSHCIFSRKLWQVSKLAEKNSSFFYRYSSCHLRIAGRTFSGKAQLKINTTTPTASSTSSSSLSKSNPKIPESLHLGGISSSALESIQKTLGNASSPYTVHGATEVMFKQCAKHAAYKTPLINTDQEIPTTEDGEEIGVADGDALWPNEFSLPATFSTWSQVTMLHMYLLVVRIRDTPLDQVKLWQQNLQDQFFFAAEDRMVVNHNMQSGSVRSKYLKDLYVQWRGLIAAYDEGLAKGDAVLASAIWRNIFKARDDIDIRYLAQIVSYMRHELQGLSSIPSISNLVKYKFGNIRAAKDNTFVQSLKMKEPFPKAA
ncbi:putative ubiquinol cytochrome-c reductase assembly protein cbp3 [Golovinomyces cichoracearum]|uniref:Putative ubiquinol cytochrome-c reductase assembly protein cbp3 n=1 Tax=Golovinomyces cichoracearum TaxID=62708 RepID=A0A420I9G2_9PEZI|nr:putative ubiquinol cytochrome-c reductase assembly protein cbp3 [Golovinomyces cichoracearum]